MGWIIEKRKGCSKRVGPVEGKTWGKIHLKRRGVKMGASLSNLTEISGAGPGLGDIPESCVACVFMYLTPPEICNLARLNRAFRGAASSDSVWESKLPSNYPFILDLLPPETYQNVSKKKDIFAILSRPVLFDDGKKAVWLDRVTGGVCVSISAKAMSITGIDDRRYWSWISTEESRLLKDRNFPGKVLVTRQSEPMNECISPRTPVPEKSYARLTLGKVIICPMLRFQVSAYLQQIWWFEVDGSLKFSFPAGAYSLSFRLHLGKYFRRLGRRVCNYEHTHGWEIKPVRFEISTSDGLQLSREYCLDGHENVDANGNGKRSIWIDYYVGDLIISSLEMVQVRFSMKQIDCTHSKGGLCLDSVSIMPTEMRNGTRNHWCG